MPRQTVGPTVGKLLVFAAGFVAAGIYFILHKDPARPNLAVIVGVAACLIGAGLFSLSCVWAYRFKLSGDPRRVRVVSVLKQDADAADSAVLEVSRPAQGATDFVRSYKVRIDGSIVSDLKIGDTCQVTVSSGPHSVEVLIEQNASEVLTINFAEGSIHKFVVAPTEGTLSQRRAQHWLQLVPIPSEQTMKRGCPD